MPSSTSSSEASLPEIPRRSLLGTTLLGAAGAVLLTAAFEQVVRRRGFQAELRDSPELWYRARRRANELGNAALALVGSSRFQVGLDPKVLAAALPTVQPLQLAINGSPALPVLGNLAADEGFRGTVLCEVMPQSFFVANAWQAAGVPWLAYAESRPAVAPVEDQLRRLVQEEVAFIQPALDGRTLLRRALLRAGWPPLPYFRFREDRFIEADYSQADTPSLLKQWASRARLRAKPPTEGELVALLERVAGWCRRLEARGGRVIFVRMISSLEVRSIEDHAFPRVDYWNRLLRYTRTAGVYDRDLAGFDSLVCPEGSHLDLRQARSFTQQLATAIREQGLLT